MQGDPPCAGIGTSTDGEAFCRPYRDSARFNSENSQPRKPSRAGAPSLPVDRSNAWDGDRAPSLQVASSAVVLSLPWGRRAREEAAVWKAPLLGLAPWPGFGTGVRLTRPTGPRLQKGRRADSPDQRRRNAGILVGAEVTSSLTAILAGGAGIGSLPLAFRASFTAGRSFERTCSNSFTASASSFLSASM
jgi:hypothetical protein